MGIRKLEDHFIHKETIIQRLVQAKFGRVTDLKKLGKNDLCWKALDNKLISSIECSASLNKRTSTIPCYLFTHVHNLEARTLIEQYVRNYSLLFTRGSYIANLATIQMLPTPEQYPIDFPFEAFCNVPPYLEDENDLKKCFYPERWSDANKVPKEFRDILQEYRDLLNPYLPIDSKLSNCGWDNALNHMGSMYMGHIKVKILTHLPERIFKYLKTHKNNETQDMSLKVALLYYQYPSTGIHNDDYEKISNIRQILNVKSDNLLVEGIPKVNNYIWSLHLWLNHYETNGETDTSVLPVVTLNRKYAYLDNKILQALLPTKVKKEMMKKTENHTGSDIQKLLGLTVQMFNKNKKILRKALRRRRKMKDKKTLKNKWRSHGRGSLPKNAKIVCISTYGVGLRLCCEFTPKRPAPKVEEEIFPIDSVRLAADTGRVRLSTSVDSNGNVIMMKRKAYKFAQRDVRFKNWEQSRMVNTPWGTALAAMSQAGGLRNSNITKWFNTLTAQNLHKDVILQEQLFDTERARKKMARFRWKKSWLDRRVRELLAPAYKDKKHLIIGIGDGKFASGGKGETSVPTVGLLTALKKAIKMMNLSRLVKVLYINEYNTTQCCHECGNKMSKLKTSQNHDCRRYFLCTHCRHKSEGKRRHRDVNAAKNILKLLDLRIKGLLRPEYLVCPWIKNVAFPPLVKTA